MAASVLAASVLMAGCAKDDGFDDDTKDGACHIVPSSAGMESLTVTRSISGYQSLDTIYKKKNSTFEIAVMWFDPVYQAKNATERQSDIDNQQTTVCNGPQTFTYNPTTTSWSSTLYLVSGREYRMYAFSNVSGSTPEMNIAADLKGATITVKDIPVIGNADMMYSAGNSNTYGTTSVDRDHAVGNFLYNVRDAASYGTNETFLALKHLLSQISLQIKVDTTYTELRDIYLKKAYIKPQAGSASKVNAQLIYKESSVDIGWTTSSSSSAIDSVLIYNNAEGHRLETKNYLTLDSCFFVPLYNADNLAGSASMAVTFEFDVYDKASGKTRENVKVTSNSLSSQLSKNTGSLASGNKYKMKVNVKPTYLYVLSENDASAIEVELE